MTWSFGVGVSSVRGSQLKRGEIGRVCCKSSCPLRARYAGTSTKPKGLTTPQNHAHRVARHGAGQPIVVDHYRRGWRHSNAPVAALALEATGRVAWWQDAEVPFWISRRRRSRRLPDQPVDPDRALRLMIRRAAVGWAKTDRPTARREVLA